MIPVATTIGIVRSLELDTTRSASVEIFFLKRM